MIWSMLIAKLISMLMSWMDAGNLRNRVYCLEDENEIMWTALEDIRRMDPEGRMGWHAKMTQDRVKGRK